MRIKKSFIILSMFFLFISQNLYSAKKEENTKKEKYKDYSSVFLKTNVTKKNSFKVELSIIFDYQSSQVIKNEVPLGSKYSWHAYNFLTFLDISYGILNGFAVGINFGFIFDRYDNNKSSSSSGEDYHETMFNPELYLKWKAVNRKAEGMNLTIFFGLQPAKNHDLFAGKIYQAYIVSGADSFRLGFFMDFPYKNISFYLNTIITLGIRFEGDSRGYYSNNETKVMLSDGNKTYYVLFAETGIHIFANQDFNIDITYRFVYNSGLKYESSIAIFTFNDVYYFALGIKINFLLSVDMKLTFEFLYNIYSNIESSLGLTTVSVKYDTASEIERSYKMYLKFLFLIDT